MRAADALMESLKAEGVKDVFGIPGGANLPTYDAMVDADFRHVQVRHEQGGGHAAEGYAQTSGRVGVSFAVTDPRQIPEYVHQAFHVASTGRPGPVLLDIPQDLSRADIDYLPRTEPVELPGYKPSTEGNNKQIRIAAKAIANALRP